MPIGRAIDFHCLCVRQVRIIVVITHGISPRLIPSSFVHTPAVIIRPANMSQRDCPESFERVHRRVERSARVSKRISVTSPYPCARWSVSSGILVMSVRLTNAILEPAIFFSIKNIPTRLDRESRNRTVFARKSLQLFWPWFAVICRAWKRIGY